MSIYMIRAGDDGPVKIGYAVRPAKRLKVMQTASAVELRLLRVFDCPREHEGLFHRHYRERRIKGEWFTFCPTMLTIENAPPKPPKPPKDRRRKPVRTHHQLPPLPALDGRIELPHVLALLTNRCAEAGSQQKWAKQNGISASYVTDILKGRRDPGKSVLDVLGLVKTIEFVEIASDGDASAGGA